MSSHSQYTVWVLAISESGDNSSGSVSLNSKSSGSLLIAENAETAETHRRHFTTGLCDITALVTELRITWCFGRAIISQLGRGSATKLCLFRDRNCTASSTLPISSISIPQAEISVLLIRLKTQHQKQTNCAAAWRSKLTTDTTSITCIVGLYR